MIDLKLEQLAYTHLAIFASEECWIVSTVGATFLLFLFPVTRPPVRLGLIPGCATFKLSTLCTRARRDRRAFNGKRRASDTVVSGMSCDGFSGPRLRCRPTGDRCVKQATGFPALQVGKDGV